MKRLLLILILMLVLGILYATPLTLDEQISQLQNANPKERFELMNALKLRISTMNTNERSSAIKQLKVQLHKNSTPSKNTSMQQHQQQMLATDQMQQMHKSNHAKGPSSGIGNPDKPGNGNGNLNR